MATLGTLDPSILGMCDYYGPLMRSVVLSCREEDAVSVVRATDGKWKRWRILMMRCGSLK